MHNNDRKSYPQAVSKDSNVAKDHELSCYSQQQNLNLALESTHDDVKDDVKSNLSRLLKIVIFLLFVSGIIGLGHDLKNKYLKIQKIQQVKQADNLLAQQKYSAAIAAYDQLLQNNPVQPHRLWINRGYAWFGLNQYQEMLQSCSTATLVQPQAPLAWNCRGEALYYLGQNETALAALQKAIAINAQDATFWLNQSTVLAALQRHQQAINALDQALELLLQSKPKNFSEKQELAIAFNLQGQNWLKLRRNQQALMAFEQSLKYIPNYLVAQQGLGVALYRLGEYSQAISIFGEILQRDDLSSEQKAISWLYQGISLCEISKITAAQSAFEQVLQLATNPQSRSIAQKGCGLR